jgi:hypothetical protein
MIIDGLLKLCRIYMMRFNVSAALSIKVTVLLGVAQCRLEAQHSLTSQDIAVFTFTPFSCLIWLNTFEKKFKYFTTFIIDKSEL